MNLNRPRATALSSSRVIQFRLSEYAVFEVVSTEAMRHRGSAMWKTSEDEVPRKSNRSSVITEYAGSGTPKTSACRNCPTSVPFRAPMLWWVPFSRSVGRETVSRIR